MSTTITVDEKKKRGRRKKLLDIVDNSLPDRIVASTNIQYILEEPDQKEPEDEQKQEEEKEQKVELEPEAKEEEPESNEYSPNPIVALEEPSSKKRGRKPKGGKIITKTADNHIKPQQIANVILHLKCSLNDLNDYNTHMNQQITNPLEYNPSIPPSIMTYNNDETHLFSVYEPTDSNNINNNNNNSNTSTHDIPNNTSTNIDKPSYAYTESLNIHSSMNGNICSVCNNENNSNQLVDDDDSQLSMKDINYKLKRLKINLYKNSMPDKKSACFWCTYDYDNPACYIPKYEMDDSIFGYGSFCRPECAVAYLMKESIDDSTKFERYHLLNQIYSKVYNYKKNIKPSPDPHYLLDKFYGNLTIQEYRKLLKSEHMLLVIDKPLTRILPELHEDSEEFILNIYGNSKTGVSTSNVANTSGIYKVKKQSEKQQGPSKNSIMRDKFGIAQ